MGCCGCCGNSDELPKGMVTKGRHCTDVPCLLLFLLFWGGMGWVGYTATRSGDPQKIIYGLDSFGNYCGMVNTRGNVTIDLTNATKLYYLDPLELLDPSNYYYASAVCVSECPGVAQKCTAGEFPCRDADNYVCPYYGFSQFTANGTDQLGILGPANEGDADTGWWVDLPNLQETQCADPALLATIPEAVSAAFNATGSCGYYYQMTSLYPGAGPCSAVLFETKEFMKRCYPVISKSDLGNITAAGAAGIAASVSQVSADKAAEMAQRIAALADGGWNTYVTDAQRGYTIVLVAGPVAALVICLLYMVFMRFFAGVMAWGVVIAINLLLIALTLLAAYKSALLGSVPGLTRLNDIMADTGGATLSGNYQQAVEITTYVLAAVTVIVLLLTLLMIRRIKIAVACLKCAASAVGTMPSIMFFPLLTFSFFIALFAYWVRIFAYQWSAGTVTPVTDPTRGSSDFYTLSWMYSPGGSNTTIDGSSGVQPAPAEAGNSTVECYEDPNCYYDVQFSQEQMGYFGYHLFGLLWTNQVIVGFGYLVIAHCIGQYYWTRGLREHMTNHPVLTGIRVALRYHLGSVAFGGFIVAVIQFVRLLLEYMDRKTKKMQKNNVAAKWLMCCLKYCLWYLEKIIKFINRNAYIIVAIKGYTYCGAAIRAFKLIVNNLGRLAAVNVIGDALIFLGKLTVVAACGCIAFLMTDLPLWSDPESDKYVASPLVPVALTCLAAYVVANIFFSVYEMAVDTILVSFCEDCMSHNETPQYAPKLLMSALGKAAAFRKQQAEASAKKVADGGITPGK